jgi:tRNA-modifying protein YgfZ
MEMKDATETPRNVPPPNPAASPGYAALHGSAAVVDRPAAVLRLSGKDPRGMLNAILTSDVPQGEKTGAYALLLDPKGRIQTDLRVLKSGHDLLILTEPEGAEAAEAILGRYAPFSRVKLEDLSDEWSVLGLYGPKAGTLLGGPDLAEHGTAEVQIDGEALLAAGVAAPVPGYDLLGPSEAVARAKEILAARGAIVIGADVYETARVEAGIPRFGADLTPENFPGEAGVLGRAVDFKKGCYPGQETVARMHYRGHPNRTLYKISYTSEHLAAGTPILQGEKAVGALTSVAPLPVDGETLALCYLSRNTDLDAPIVAAGSELRVLGEAS